MLVQDWYNANVPADNMVYHQGATNQFIWVRDTLASVVLIGLIPRFPEELKTWEDREKHTVVYSTHTSKSIVLPVYTFAVGNVVIDVRGNFHDWCVGVQGVGVPPDKWPQYLQDSLGRGFYEGMGDYENKYDYHFCCRSQEQLYAILWWLVNYERE